MQSVDGSSTAGDRGQKIIKQDLSPSPLLESASSGDEKYVREREREGDRRRERRRDREQESERERNGKHQELHCT